MLRPGDRNPFADADDGMQRPAWEATLLFLCHGQRREDLPPALQEHVDVPYWIPHWRLTPPLRDLLAELQERPLLSLYRFRRTPDAPLCGQVVAYHPAARINLVDDINLLVEPSSGYICRVTMRHYAGEQRQVVAIPLDDVRVNHISQAEYLLEVSHGVPLASAPAHLAATWSALDPGSTSDPTTVLRRVAAAFVVPGTPLMSTVDTSERAVVYIAPPPREEKAQTTVVAYVVASNVSGAVDGECMSEDHSPVLLPLLEDVDTLLTPSDKFNMVARSPTPAPGATTMASIPAGPGPSVLSPALLPTTDGSLHRRSRSRSRSPRRRSRSRGRSPGGYRITGSNRFRPTDNEARAHEVAHVGPRSVGGLPGTAEPFDRFRAMPTQDRVCSMLQHERFRGIYRVTKVTVKMLYAVNFDSRPIDHFLSSEDPVAYASDRTVIHEDTQWGGAELPSAHQIRRADQFHHVLYAIQDAAAEWYPMDVVAVFCAVHSHAVRDVPGTAPPQEIHAICNLYSAVFSALFDEILHRVHSRDLLDRALQALRRDSPVYQRFVARVLDDDVHRAVLRTPAHNSGGQQGQRQTAYNVAADALCNWIMDVIPPGVDVTLHGDVWPAQLSPHLTLSPAVLLPFQPAALDSPSDLIAHASAAWSLVLQELYRFQHLIRRPFLSPWANRPVHTRVSCPVASPQVTTPARRLSSPFASNARRSCLIDGVVRCVPAGVFTALRDAARQVGVQFPMASAFRAAGPGPLTIPTVDAVILDALIAASHLGIAGTLRIFRGQTPADGRPNKALRPWLYRVQLASYP
ncbi:hypothetical protein BBJ28_00016057 [Nothophytophthora sp. Chile5]|nr:hypothetical protein BBJ28_00016057 [Nothophytophthora sp. Chile5]